MSTELDPTITLTDEGDWWVARDTETGVTSQGETRTEALDNLDEAIAAYHGAGSEPTDAELAALGIDPDDNESTPLDESDLFE
ncbi:type II toxin-antitoxin system HicB family antitoxin [Halobaculum sp. MBLA0147]|uniref:type II toxin-antitoxin system HicB family antitoxin n=1 Tax=Halobaculum sp. MBLA0147 TaxID=3079934 RepID=UPI003524C50E